MAKLPDFLRKWLLMVLIYHINAAEKIDFQNDCQGLYMYLLFQHIKESQVRAHNFPTQASKIYLCKELET